MARKKTTAADEQLTVERIEEFSPNFGEVHVKVIRRDSTGRVISIRDGARKMPIMDLLQDSFEKWVRERGGGGLYEVMVADPNNLLHQLWRFKMHLDGAPKLPDDEPTQQAYGPPPPFQQGVQYAYAPPPRKDADGKRLDPREIAAYTSDQVAMGRIQRLEQERVEERTEHKKRLEALEKRLEAAEASKREFLEQQLRTEAGLAEKRHALELETLRKEMELLRQQPKQEAPKQVDFVALFAAAVPLLTAFMEANKARAQLEQNSHKQMMDMQAKSTENLTKVLIERKNTEAEGLKMFTPMMKAMTDTMNSSAENQLTSLSLAAQTITDMMGGQEDHPVMRIVETATRGLSDIAQQMQNNKRTMQQVTRQMAPREVTAEVVNGPPDQQLQEPPAQQSETVTELVDQLMKDPRFPPALQSAEWRELLIAVHARTEPEEMAKALTNYFVEAHNNDTLPQQLHEVFDAPGGIMQQILGMMPIWQIDQAYCRDVLERFIKHIQETSDEPEEAPPVEVVNAAPPAHGQSEAS